MGQLLQGFARQPRAASSFGRIYPLLTVIHSVQLYRRKHGNQGGSKPDCQRTAGAELPGLPVVQHQELPHHPAQRQNQSAQQVSTGCAGTLLGQQQPQADVSGTPRAGSSAAQRGFSVSGHGLVHNASTSQYKCSCIEGPIFPTKKTKMFYGQIQAGPICVIAHSAHFWPKSSFKCCTPQITELLLGTKAFSFV